MKTLNAQRAVDLLQSKTCGIYKTSLLKEIIEGKILVGELEDLLSLFDQPNHNMKEES